MPQFAANLSMLYPDLAFLDRFDAAAGDGFAAVEYLFPYAHSASEIAARLRANGLQQVLFNTPPGGLDAAHCLQAWAAGDRGTACVPGREAEFRAGVQAALAYAEVLDCPRIHCMVGLRAEPTRPQEAEHTLLTNLVWASAQAQASGRDILIEPINPRSVPGFYLNRQDHAHTLVQRVQAESGVRRLKVQMDLFHCQIVEGDLSHKLRTWLPTGQVGHLQIADVPDRHEPGTGEIHWPKVLSLIDELSHGPQGWQGWVGCEYNPADVSPGGTSRGLRWLPKC
ncbi:MAG: Hydroxypyruvate isomerase [Pseudomonadota bacterium]|jgi:hydroxypyruvate isomerase